MPILRVDRYTREDVRRWGEAGAIVVFGDNCCRSGTANQAVIRGLSNAVGVATKRRPDMRPDAFFSDDRADEYIAIIDRDLEPVRAALRAGKLVVLPAAGLGTGLAQLPTRAPRVWAFLSAALVQLERIAASAAS
jgi:hypothetical protein